MRKKGLLFGIVSSFLLNAHAQSPQQISQPSALPFLDTTVNLFQSHQASVMGSLVEQLGLKTSSGFDILHVGDELVADIADPLLQLLINELRYQVASGAQPLLDVVLAHQSGGSSPANGKAVVLQLARHLRAAVCPVRCGQSADQREPSASGNRDP